MLYPRAKSHFPPSQTFLVQKCPPSCPPMPWVMLAQWCLFQAAQNMVTRCMAAELRDKGILCTAIHPGWVKTDMGTEKVLGCAEEGQQVLLYPHFSGRAGDVV